jgi:hypothetical protein
MNLDAFVHLQGLKSQGYTEKPSDVGDARAVARVSYRETSISFANLLGSQSEKVPKEKKNKSEQERTDKEKSANE